MLHEFENAPLSVFVVWEPILVTDSVGLKTGALARVPDRRAAQFWRRATHPPHLREFLCIHRFEGAWSSATGNGYYGGLQMDLSFQRRYAGGLLRSKGTADHWSPLEQIWAAERAHRSGLGFTPWPNTARVCGLF